VEVKMRRVILMMAACCVLASPALAGGGVDLYGVYGEVVDGEYELGLGARFSLGGTHWMFDIAVTEFMEVEDTPIIDQNPVIDDSFKYRAFDLGLRYLFYEGHKLRPYVGGGISYAQASATHIRVDSGLGLYGMVGIRYGKTPGINFMAELIYRWAEVQARYGLVDERDVTVGGLGLQVGISFVF
jgi:hypothetical protein